LMPAAQIERVLQISDKLVLIDETYFEFSGITYKDWIAKYPNLLITRSFSKAFSAAGLRFGYLISSAANITQLKKVITAFNLSLMTQTIVLTILENRQIFLDHTQKVVQMRNYLCAELNKIPGLQATNTQTNFLILTIGEKTRELFDFLSENEIALRDVGAHPVMKNQIRVTISAPAENELFLSKVREFMIEEEIR
ncbi:MAG: aminotransferase class I/II-fold pyridoxal phosphate-dependent enzyme, partial [Candidatus Cloacimonadales bacterium]